MFFFSETRNLRRYLKGIFTISLDFELHWGGFEKWPLEKYRQYFLNTREVIPWILLLFEKYEVHATWATVGMLFNQNRDQLLKNAPSLKPGYQNTKLSAYNFIETNGIGSDEDNDPFHFAPTLINKISNTPFQEIGTHTYTHYYCNEEGQTIEQFRADLRTAQHVAQQNGLTLRSLVFPRNQFNDQYLRVCFEEGITSVRSNPLDWFWNIQRAQNESLTKRLNRGLDAYFPLGKKNTYPLNSISVREGFPICIPASRLLRPYRPSEFILNDLKINRIRSEMERAAIKGEVYHLWWHPHNFGNYPQESLAGLEKILDHFASCKSKHGMLPMSMGEISLKLFEGNLMAKK